MARLELDEFGVSADPIGRGLSQVTVQHVKDDGIADPVGLLVGEHHHAQLAAAVAKSDAEVSQSAKPSHALASYAGTYRDAWYGDVDVSLVRGELHIRFTHSPRLVGSLLPRGTDTFLARWDDRSLTADALIDFEADPSGHITAARMRRASPRVSHAYDYQDLHLVRGGTNQ